MKLGVAPIALPPVEHVYLPVQAIETTCYLCAWCCINPVNRHWYRCDKAQKEFGTNKWIACKKRLTHEMFVERK